MTPKELRERLEPIVLDKTLSKERRDAALIPIMNQLEVENALLMSYDEIFDLWNNIMVDILMDNERKEIESCTATRH